MESVNKMQPVHSFKVCRQSKFIPIWSLSRVNAPPAFWESYCTFRGFSSSIKHLLTCLNSCLTIEVETTTNNLLFWCFLIFLFFVSEIANTHQVITAGRHRSHIFDCNAPWWLIRVETTVWGEVRDTRWRTGCRREPEINEKNLHFVRKW